MGSTHCFHEGGHAAHFANVKWTRAVLLSRVCTDSMAYAETQSMFCDSLLNDADWLKQYAVDADGQPVLPDELIKAMIDSKQPFRAYRMERSIRCLLLWTSAVWDGWWRSFTPEKITELARRSEKSILGLDCSPRPLMAIPHLLSDEASCAYQGYLLAHMAVYQTRAYFTDKFGYLTDNPEIGPLLATLLV